MKFYIATGLQNAAVHNRLRDALTALGHELTYDWTVHGSLMQASDGRKIEVAQHEARGVLEADFVALLLPGGRGTHAELGMAIAAGIQTFVHVPEGQSELDATGKHCLFHYHPSAEFVRGDLLELVMEISRWVREEGAGYSYGQDRVWARKELLSRFHPDPLPVVEDTRRVEPG